MVRPEVSCWRITGPSGIPPHRAGHCWGAQNAQRNRGRSLARPATWIAGAMNMIHRSGWQIPGAAAGLPLVPADHRGTMTDAKRSQTHPHQRRVDGQPPPQWSYARESRGSPGLLSGANRGYPARSRRIPRRAVQRRPVVLVQAAQATEGPGSHCGRRYFSDWCGAVKAIEFAVTPTSPRLTLSIVGGSSFPGGGVAAPSARAVPSSRVAVSESR